MKKLDVKLYKMVVNKGKEEVAKKWLSFLKSNAENAVEGLENGKVYLESYFTTTEGDTMIVYCFMAADNIDYANGVARKSESELDKQHFAYGAECISQTEGEILDCFLYIENIKSL